MARRVVAKKARRTVAGGASAGALTLDNRPLELVASRDGKRVIAVLPYEVWVINIATLDVEKTIELGSAKPSVFEAETDGVAWFGGQHLHRGSLFAGGATKVGSKLGGFVDRVCLVRPTLLCGVGTHGEVLWDVEQEADLHRRKVTERRVCGLVVTPDGRAAFADGTPQLWVIDPDHASGYMKLKLKRTSEIDVRDEAISTTGLTQDGRCILAARDGAVGWTNRALRLVHECFPKPDGGDPTPLAVTGDPRWVYVLRRGGVLDRYLVEQPEANPEAKEEPEPLPEAQRTRLERPATAMVLVGEQLVLAGPQHDDQLGRLWVTKPEDLDWSTLSLGKRRLVDAPAATESQTRKVPDFTPTRSKLEGPPIADIKVDDVLASTPPFWVTRGQGTLLDRPAVARAAADVLPGDALLLPAMLRLHEGTVRPGLVLWPGVASEDRAIPSVQWLTWGDEPRAWIKLDTPQIRAQGWSRREVFPLQTALKASPPDVAGRRPAIADRWVDPELFSALVKECKKLLRVVW